MFAKSANKISGFVLLIECRFAGRGGKKKSKKALPFFFFFNSPPFRGGVDCCGIGGDPSYCALPYQAR